MRLSLWRSTAIVSVVVMLAGCSISSPTSTATTTPSSHSATAGPPLRRVGSLPPQLAVGDYRCPTGHVGRVGPSGREAA
jgi:hypothetical protein